VDKELASGTLKDIELGECKLELGVDFYSTIAALTVSPIGMGQT